MVRTPKLVAFDLDATLWYPEMDMTYGPPYTYANGVVRDAHGTEVELMGASYTILNELATNSRWESTAVAYVSRTDCVKWAQTCLQLFKVAEGTSMDDLAMYKEIYPGSKKTHFRRIRQQSGIDYADMLFFDNERRNILDCSSLGITCIYTPHGMTADAWQDGLEAHAAAAAR